MRFLAAPLTPSPLQALGFLSPPPAARAQAPGPGIGFRNDLKAPVIVQGVSQVGNMHRRGQPFLVRPGKTVWDNNVPNGMRYYTIYDANQQRIMVREQPVPVQAADQFFVIRLAPGNTGQ